LGSSRSKPTDKAWIPQVTALRAHKPWLIKGAATTVPRQVAARMKKTIRAEPRALLVPDATIPFKVGLAGALTHINVSSWRHFGCFLYRSI
jgi:hypothetical protein